jgi:mitochondrial chaperone BCS1
MDYARRKDEGKTIIYNGMGGHWQRFGPARAARPLESVILADGYCEEILKDIDSFLKGSSWYLKRGIPYRRGSVKNGYKLSFAFFSFLT